MTRWLTNRRVVTLGLAGAALTAGIAGPATAASAAPGGDAAPAPATVTTVPTLAKALDHDFQLQETGYYCGPAAARVALTALHKNFSQDQVAEQLGTTVSGTDSIHDVTRVLNAELGDRYIAVEVPGRKATDEQTARFKADLVTAINSGEVVVANIVGTATDEAGATRSYDGGHYLAIVGFDDYGDTVEVVDSAGQGDTSYEMSADAMADWIADRGYTA